MDKFLQKVQDSYYRLHPNKIAYKPGVTPSEIREKYRSYDPSPNNIKLITDEAWALLDEINKKNFEAHRLKPRERKALAQVKHYLQHVFGNPFDVNYYAGDFLMGPNLWCWQPLCDTPYEIKKSLQYFQPNTTKDLENLQGKLAEIKKTFVQYRNNMEYGVLVGMVRSVEECKAGINGLTSYFREISIKGAKGKVFAPLSFFRTTGLERWLAFHQLVPIISLCPMCIICLLICNVHSWHSNAYGDNKFIQYNTIKILLLLQAGLLSAYYLICKLKKIQYNFDKINKMKLQFFFDND